MEQFKMAGCIWAIKMKEPALHSIGKIIQWATNQQLDLMAAYEQQWGVASKNEVWENYTRFLKTQLPLRVDEKRIDQRTIQQLIAFLSDIQQPYHLEMSSDEMAHLFLDFLEKN